MPDVVQIIVNVVKAVADFVVQIWKMIVGG